MDRAVFFDYLTGTDPGLFPEGLTKAQRAGITVKLDVWARWYAADFPLTYLAAALGQIFHETGGRMEPVLEAFAPDRPTSAERLQKAWEAGRLKWVKTPYWQSDETGRHPVGGGDIQLTHRRNYVNADERLRARFGVRTGLSDNYDVILDPVISAHVAFSGMIEGWFRPCRLDDFRCAGGLDYAAARDIVNGDAGLVGDRIARNCQVFEAALVAAGADLDFGAPETEVDWPGQ
jgi:putative chitinase